MGINLKEIDMMTEQAYRIKVKSNNFEVEVEGDKDFVTGEFKEVMDRLVELEVSESGLIQSAKVATLPSIISQNPQVLDSFPVTESATENPTEISVTQPEPPQSGMAKLAKEVGITEEELKNIYDFKDGQIFIHKLVDGQTDSDKQRKVTKLALIAHEVILNKSELSGKALGAYMRNLGIGNMGNLAANLVSDSGIYRINNLFKLRQAGRNSAITLIKELAKHTV